MLRELPNQFGGFVIPDDKLTPNGGAAAIGHPFGATGTRYVSDLIGQSVNKLGWWAPWTGATVYALGLMLHYGPPAGFLPWLLAILFITYSSQILSRRPHSPRRLR